MKLESVDVLCWSVVLRLMMMMMMNHHHSSLLKPTSMMPKPYSRRGSNSWPCACWAHVITNYTTGATSNFQVWGLLNLLINAAIEVSLPSESHARAKSVPINYTDFSGFSLRVFTNLCTGCCKYGTFAVGVPSNRASLRWFTEMIHELYIIWLLATYHPIISPV